MIHRFVSLSASVSMCAAVFLPTVALAAAPVPVAVADHTVTSGLAWVQIAADKSMTTGSASFKFSQKVVTYVQADCPAGYTLVDPDGDGKVQFIHERKDLGGGIFTAGAPAMGTAGAVTPHVPRLTEPGDFTIAFDKMEVRVQADGSIAWNALLTTQTRSINMDKTVASSVAGEGPFGVFPANAFHLRGVPLPGKGFGQIVVPVCVKAAAGGGAGDAPGGGGSSSNMSTPDSSSSSSFPSCPAPQDEFVACEDEECSNASSSSSSFVSSESSASSESSSSSDVSSSSWSSEWSSSSESSWSSSDASSSFDASSSSSFEWSSSYDSSWSSSDASSSDASSSWYSSWWSSWSSDSSSSSSDESSSSSDWWSSSSDSSWWSSWSSSSNTSSSSSDGETSGSSSSY